MQASLGAPQQCLNHIKKQFLGRIPASFHGSARFHIGLAVDGHRKLLPRLHTVQVDGLGQSFFTEVNLLVVLLRGLLNLTTSWRHLELIAFGAIESQPWEIACRYVAHAKR